MQQDLQQILFLYFLMSDSGMSGNCFGIFQDMK